MTKANPQLRHHAAHPPSVVKPNLAVNKKPNPAPVEKAALPNPNPSLGPVGVAQRAPRVPRLDEEPDGVDDPDVPEEDRLSQIHLS